MDPNGAAMRFFFIVSISENPKKIQPWQVAISWKWWNQVDPINVQKLDVEVKFL